jgi:tripartite-type tricarboxylate transporter receptor subunit TctC
VAKIRSAWVIVLLLASPPLFAQQYPVKPIRFLVGFAPGGSTDIVARLLAQKMAESFNQQVVVDNRTGAGGMISAEALAKSPPDGYTIQACTTGMFAIQPFLYKKLPFDPEKDLQHVTQTGSLPYIVVVHPSIPAKSIRDLLAIAKRRPGDINFASSGIGTASHLSAELFQFMGGVKLTHVPYKGTGQALADLLAGQVVLIFDQPVSTMPHVRAGKLNVLAFSSLKRFPTMPEIPTIHESGIPGYESVSFAGVCVPYATPRDIVNRLHGEIVRVLKLPDIRDRLLRDGIEPIGSTPEEFSAFTRREREKWGKVVRDANVRVE